ncbi:helix-turn-helix domain-containing protein [Ralstonia solanacearum]|uniref:helix-turn-helix domain-containing protein n=1 Tax=Ralstonia solanacearum TaxID=305 RepID=UPI003CC5A472
MEAPEDGSIRSRLSLDGQLRPRVAAERLEITDRQCRRLIERYRQEGPSGLVSRKRGRPSNNRLSSERDAAVLGLIQDHYADFGPTLACEKLRERRGLTLSKETIRRLMTAAAGSGCHAPHHRHRHRHRHRQAQQIIASRANATSRHSSRAPGKVATSCPPACAGAFHQPRSVPHP